MATKTRKQILSEIKRLEDAERKEHKKFGAKYQKAIDNLYLAEDREEKKHPENFRKIATKYLAKQRELLSSWYKSTATVSAKYRPKLERLYGELRSAK